MAEYLSSYFLVLVLIGIQKSKLRDVSDPIIGQLYENMNVSFVYLLAIALFWRYYMLLE